MSSLVGLYYDAGGNLTKIVRPHFDEPKRILTDADFAAHDDKTLTRVNMDAATYAGLPAPIQLNGVAVHQDLNIAAQPLLAQKSPQLGLLLQANITTVANTLAALSAQLLPPVLGL
jgi:hypothetical protein